MSSNILNRPVQWEETVVAGAILATYLLYLAGALYLVGPALAWILGFWGLSRSLTAAKKHVLPASLWVVIIAMAIMLLALWLGLLDFRRPWTMIVKSTVGWAKGWALLALFPFAAWALELRTDVIAAASSGVAMVSLALTPFLWCAATLGLPEILYVSPLSMIGGATDHFFWLRLYSGDFGELRLWYFAPWAPAAALYSCLLVLIVRRDPNPRRRRWATLGALTMTLMSGSRLGLVALVSLLGLSWGLAALKRPWAWFLATVGFALLPAFAAPIWDGIESAYDGFVGARIESSRVRSALARLALQRWQEDGFWWGHGTVEKGPWSVEFMPIGSHNTWLGLLFVKGLVGVLALVAVFGAGFLSLWRRRRHPDARTAAAILWVLLLFTLGENLEILTYLFWPALLVLGNGLKVPISGRDGRPEATG